MLVIGTRFYPVEGAAGRRQARAREALLALPDAVPVNLQFAGETFAPAGFTTRAVLRRDSRTVTGAPGRRKPIVSEMFDALAAEARRAGADRFAYLNADIEVTPDALPWIAAAGDGCAFSRIDVDPGTGREIGIEVRGIDMFAVRAGWWEAERRRFRPYIAGEACWDNVYAAILCSHGDALIATERPGIFHERHETEWGDGPFARHNGFLAALDAPYFSRWVSYTAALEAACAAGARPPRGQLETRMFRDNPIALGEAARHLVRQARARARHAWRAGARAGDHD